MPEHQHDQSVPRGALLGATGLILLSLGLAANARREHLAMPAAPEPAPLVSREVSFEDRPDGRVAMIDATTGREVASIPPQSNGFVRGVLRGMFRGRKLESLGHDARFRLSRQATGRLTIEDPETGRRVDLDSFGPTNAAAFANLMVAAEGQP
jgi:putative photosynthetic complex assembly protein